MNDLNNNITIAVDGFAACGKSTLAKALAKELGYIYIDSGAMYRAVTLYFLDNSIDIEDDLSVASALEQIRITFRNIDGNNHTFLNEKDVENEIRAMRVSDFVTVVFPDAELKLFMTASPEVRTKRRLLELESKGISDYSFEQVQKNLTERDRIDSTRSDSPLRKADDAIVIDNSALSTGEQLMLALTLANEIIEKKNIRESVNG